MACDYESVLQILRNVPLCFATLICHPVLRIGFTSLFFRFTTLFCNLVLPFGVTILHDDLLSCFVTLVHLLLE